MTTSKWTLWFVALGLCSAVSCGGSDGPAFSRGGGGSAGDAPDGSSGADASPGGGSGGGASGGSSGSGGASGGGSGGRSSGGGAGTSGGAGAGGTADAGDASPTTDSAAAGGAAGAGPDGGGTCTNKTTYFADKDHDEYGDALSTIEACSRPAGYVENSDDCYDDNAQAKPGQSGWFTTDRGDGSFDYDCEGTGVTHWETTGTCGLGGVGICVPTEGWQGAIPACGKEGPYITACSGLAICLAQTTPRTQECH